MTDENRHHDSDVAKADEYRFQSIDKKFESLEGKQNRDFLIKW